jgi:multidrug efflux pump
VNISSFFIDRPIFATVLAIIIVVAGLVALPNLPISQYPEVVPPRSSSAASIPERARNDRRDGDNAARSSRSTALKTRSTPTRNPHRTATSRSPGRFKLGTNLDTAQVQTQNRVSQAEPRLPEVVRLVGLVTQKRSPDLTMVVFLKSPDGRYGSLYLRNYALIQIRDVLARLEGMGDVRIFGSGDYAMRLWLDPGKIASRNLTVTDVLAAVREQNVQVAAGQVGGQPALPGTQFEYVVIRSGSPRN